MTGTFTRKVLLILLAFMAALQPLLALGETSMGQMEEPSVSAPVVVMDCLSKNSHSSSEQTQHHQADDQQPGQPSGMACGSMSAQDCTLAASLGSCSALVVMMPPEGSKTPAFSATHQIAPRPHDGYQSIVLDTLTPPPNASIA